MPSECVEAAEQESGVGGGRRGRTCVNTCWRERHVGPATGPRRCLSAFISPLHNSRKLIRGSEWLIEQSGKAIGETLEAR